jgi:hypothetical protein
VQTEELQHHQEQKKTFGASKLQEILPVLQQAHYAQGDQIEKKRGTFLKPGADLIRISLRGNPHLCGSQEIPQV